MSRRTLILLIATTAGLIIDGLLIWRLVISRSEPVERTVPVAATAVNPEPEPQPLKIQLMAVGDMLIHDDVYEDFRVSNDSFDFRPAFSQVKPIISTSDLAIVNQETILGGIELGLSGLYVANSPQELGESFIDTGFNMIQLANNHAFDRGEAGIKNTLEFWRQHTEDGIITSGVYDLSKVNPEIPIIDKKGIKTAFLSYTYGSNLGLPSAPLKLNTIDRDKISGDVAEAKRRQADVIIVGLHWGTELSRQQSADQEQLAKFLAGIGVDVLYGTHAHVLQPPTWVAGANGHKMLTMYSLGNFLSIHTEDPLYTLTGAIMGVDITKELDGSIKLTNPFAIPTWNFFSPAETDFQVLPFDIVKSDDFRFGDFSAHQQEINGFLRSKLPELKILGLKDFEE